MKKSKIFSLILVVAMMLTLVALTTVPAFAEEAAPVAAEAAQEQVRGDLEAPVTVLVLDLLVFLLVFLHIHYRVPPKSGM